MPDLPLSEEEPRSVARRLSPLLARGGWVAVPSLLIEFQGRLGLTTADLTYILHVLRQKWDDDWPWVSVPDVAAAAGVHVEVARRWKRRLMQSPADSSVKYLQCTERVDRSGRAPDRHDLSGLFARLEALVLEREAQRPLDQARELPAPSFHRDAQTIPALSTARPRKNVGGSPDENVGGVPHEMMGDPPAFPPGPEPAKVPGDVESVSVEGLSELSLTRAVPAQETPGRQVRSMPASMPDGSTVNHQQRALDHPLVDESGEPDPVMAGVLQEVVDYAAAFGETDDAGTYTRAQHLLWNSQLPAYKFGELVRTAGQRTRHRVAAGRVRTPMAYYFSVLEELVVQARERRAEQAKRGSTVPAATAQAAGHERPRAHGYALWIQTLAQLESTVPPAQFDLYLRDVTDPLYDQAAGVLQVRTAFAAHVPMLVESFAQAVEAAASRVAGQPVRVRFVAPERPRHASGPHQVHWPGPERTPAVSRPASDSADGPAMGQEGATHVA